MARQYKDFFIDEVNEAIAELDDPKKHMTYYIAEPEYREDDDAMVVASMFTETEACILCGHMNVSTEKHCTNCGACLGCG
jgi:hypothetical protein